MVKNIALIMARRSMQVSGKEVLSYAIDETHRSVCDVVMVVSSNVDLLEIAKKNGCETYAHPLEMREYVAKKYPDAQNIAIICGDSVMIAAHNIDLCINMLVEHKQYTSVITVTRAIRHHPYFALCPRRVGSKYLKGAFPDTEKNCPLDRPHYYFDDGIMVYRANQLIETGPKNWPFLGKKICPVIQPWNGSVSIKSVWDRQLAEAWVCAGKKIR